MITPKDASAGLRLAGHLFEQIVYANGKVRDREEIMFVMDILNKSVETCTAPTNVAEALHTAIHGR